MKKFQFRLEPVLRLKAHREKQRQKEHALAVRQVTMQQERLASLEGDKSRTFDHQRRMQAGPISAGRLLITSRYLVKLKRDALTGREVLRGLEKTAETRRHELVEAARERKTYEKLKEKRKSAFEQDVARRERKELDEIAVTRFRRTK